MIQLQVFADLIQENKTWSEFFNKYEHIFRFRPFGDTYCVIRYLGEDKDDITDSFRSVVWNMKTHRPVCVAPVKSQDSSPPNSPDIHISQIVEGTMINVFRDHENKIRFVTRSNLDATNKFQSDMSFGSMFQEAIDESQIDFSFLQQGEYANCVLQHPENRIVSFVSKPKVYITHIGKVLENGSIISSSNTNPSTSVDGMVEYSYILPNHLQRYSPYVFKNLNIMNNIIFKSYNIKGFMIQDPNSSKRWKIINPEYAKVQELRGNDYSDVTRFLRLRKEGKVKEYLKYFREDSELFWGLEEKLRNKTHELYEAYVDMNKLKKKTMKDLPYCFRPHIYKIHGDYLKTLPNPVPVLKETIVKCVNELPVEEQENIMRGV